MLCHQANPEKHLKKTKNKHHFVSAFSAPGSLHIDDESLTLLVIESFGFGSYSWRWSDLTNPTTSNPN